LHALNSFRGDNIKISTLGSHSALNILRGAKDEGFETLLISPKERRFYERFGIADEIVYVDDMGRFLMEDDAYLKDDVIMVPHGSFISYLSLDFIEKDFSTRLFGNKYLFKWESDRDLEKEWLESSGILFPRTFDSPDDIDTPVIIKSFGAKGGMGYFLARDREDFQRKIDGSIPP